MNMVRWTCGQSSPPRLPLHSEREPTAAVVRRIPGRREELGSPNLPASSGHCSLYHRTGVEAQGLQMQKRRCLRQGQRSPCCVATPAAKACAIVGVARVSCELRFAELRLSCGLEGGQFLRAPLTPFAPRGASLESW